MWPVDFGGLFLEYSSDNEEEPTDTPENEGVEEPVPRPSGRYGVRGTKRKSNFSMVSFAVWIAFVMVWLFFFAGTGYRFFQNLAVVISSFMFIGMLNALVWAPTEWRIRLSIIVGIGWIIFLVLWWPFLAESYSGYQNFAVMLLSFLLLITLTGGPWMTQIPGEARLAFRRRMAIGILALLAYMIFLILWLWFYAGAFTLYYNVTIGLIATLVMYIIGVGVSVTESDTGLGSRWLGPGIGFVWLVILIVWFYFFASGFNEYQNFAVVLLSILLMGVIVGAIGRERWGGLDAMDWRD